jgi:hypothetical protein
MHFSRSGGHTGARRTRDDEVSGAALLESECAPVSKALH